ncbi:MAG: phytanoyl-CoA dioxygenase family protein [Verrucomicrobia bacterium]|nr:phytanoyl-CoA dioxygenase family protein [Verrucomicrobiota bacterium]
MLTQDQIDQFHRDGFVVVREAIAGAELEALRSAAAQVVQEGIAEIDPDGHRYHQMPDGSRTYRRSERMWQRADIFQATTVKPDILEMVGQCIGHPFLPMNDSMVAKIPMGNVPVFWHQDPPYGDPKLNDTYPIPNFVTDIYLDDSTIENGCVWGIPGHHLVGHVDIRSYTEEQLFNHPLAVPIEMKPGDVLLHSLSSPHGSIGNQTASTRRIFYVHYMAVDVFRDCYANVGWMGLPGGPEAKGKAFVQGMHAARQRLGFDDLNSDHIQWTDDGFTVVDGPTTPERHWADLAAAIPADERAAKQALTWRPQAVAS